MYSNGSVCLQNKVLFKFDKCSEFSLSISYIEISIFQLNFSMFPRNWNISDSYLALVTSSNLYGIILFSRYEMETSLLFTLLFIVDTLQDDIGLVGLSYSHHLHILCVITNNLRKRTLANLAFKFCEIVTLSYPLDLFLNFAVYPGFKTSHMDHSATSLTVARRNQRITFRFLTTKTYFTTSLPLFQSFIMFCQMLLNVKHSVCLFEVICRSQGRSLGFVFWFNNHVLDSAKFDNVPWI